MNRAPIETQINLFGASSNEKLTSDKRKLLSLLLIEDEQSKEVVLSGTWTARDGINVSISSSFVVPNKAEEAALNLAKASGFDAWLPAIHDRTYSGDEIEDKERGIFPFLQHSTKHAGIDEYDPLGAIVAMCKSQLAESVNSAMRIKSVDPFETNWIDTKGRIVCRSEAWGASERNREGDSKTGQRFISTKAFVTKLLFKYKMDMLLLVRLRKYEHSYGDRESEYWHTTALVHITKDWAQVYYPGLSNVKNKMG